MALTQAPDAPADSRERAEKALQAVITDYPRLSSVAQAAYLLGSVRFSAAQYPRRARATNGSRQSRLQKPGGPGGA